ncbi:HesA/MoeB/ThiF family protein [Glaciimonas sp. GG7]
MIPVKPMIKRSHHVILAENGDICIGELPESAKVIRNPLPWVPILLQKLDGKHTVPRIIKEINAKNYKVPSEDIIGFIKSLQGFGLLEANEYHSEILKSEEIERYNRQILQFLVKEKNVSSPIEYQEKLKKSTILILGMGGWGTWCALNLALNGVGKIKIVDGDIIELSNLNRQVLYTSDDIGCEKVKAAEKSIKRINPNVEVEIFFEFVIDDPNRIEEYLSGVDFVVLAWASLGYYKKGTIEEIVHAKCSQLRIPIIELGGDPIEISAGPIYENKDGINIYSDLNFKKKNRVYSDNDSILIFQKARMKNSLLNGNREVNAWQSSPSLSVMSGIVVDQIIKYITNHDTPHLVGKRVFMSMSNFHTKEIKIF